MLLIFCTFNTSVSFETWLLLRQLLILWKMRLSRLTILASSALAMLVTLNIKLETLTVCFLASRAFTITTLPVLHNCKSIRIRRQFLAKCKWIALQDFCPRLLDLVLMFSRIATVCTCTTLTTFFTLSKTFTIHFQALCA